MTDKALTQGLIEALDARIARAEAAPQPKAPARPMPEPEALCGTVIQAVPARQIHWRTAAAALLVLCALGGLGLLASRLLGRQDPNLAQLGEPDPTQVSFTTEAPASTAPTEAPDPALPQVTYETDTRTLRVVGTGNYSGIDLSQLPEALALEVEDDDFTLTVLPTILYSDDCTIRDDPAGYLPGYLDRLDGSLATIRQFVADNAPNEAVAARTRKPVNLYLQTLRFEDYRCREEQIELRLGGGYRWHGVLYTLALLDTEVLEWKQISYAYWVAFCLDPYNSVYTLGQEDPDPDYYYMRDYYRLGGTGDWHDLNQQRLMVDVCSWYNLVYGRDWEGNEAERGRICDLSLFSGRLKNKEGNSLSLSMAESLLGWLADQYGADQVTAFCFDACSFPEAFGCDFQTALAAWEADLMARFGPGDPDHAP